MGLLSNSPLVFAELAFHPPIQPYFSMQGIFQDERRNLRCKGHFPTRHFCRSKAYFPGFQFQPVLCCDFFLAADDRLTIFRYYDTDSPHFSHRPPLPLLPLPRPAASLVAFRIVILRNGGWSNRRQKNSKLLPLVPSHCSIFCSLHIRDFASLSLGLMIDIGRIRSGGLFNGCV